MKCINKLTAIVISGCLIICSAAGCGSSGTPIATPYDISENAYQVSTTVNATGSFFATQLCVGGTTNVGMDSVDSQVAESAGVFQLATGDVTYAQNIYEKRYPASTTKILTAYLAIKYGNLDDVVTVSDTLDSLDSSSSVCGLKVGDKITLRDVLYGLMMRSGNDAAVAIAEHISGSCEKFADLMNQEAKLMGATTSHFVNPHGLPDEDHYTSVYDLYLIFQKAITESTFREIITATTYTANYTHADGTVENPVWSSTNQYFSGEASTPEGFTVIGGKTGTTGAAGYCLVLLSENSNGEEVISIVLKADGKSNLYLLMSEILKGYGN